MPRFLKRNDIHVCTPEVFGDKISKTVFKRKIDRWNGFGFENQVGS